MKRNIISDAENEISSWRENFLYLDDKYFFTLMRLYLGELKTPYNKQKLVLQLEGFLRREETQKNIVALLSEQDIQILCAIKFSPQATEDNLRDFFEGDIQQEDLHEYLNELKARLLIYEDSSGKNYNSNYKITPLLKDILENVLHKEKLFPEFKGSTAAPSISNGGGISIELVAAFLSYVAANKKICKLDGSFKKHTEEDLKQKFPGQLKRLRLLARALVNLGLVKETSNESSSGGYEINWKKTEEFSKLKKIEQLIYLLVAAPAHYTRERARVYAQYFLNALNAIPSSGFKESVFLRYIYFLSLENFSSPVATQSRFSKLIQRESESASINSFFERMLDDAITLGIVDSVPVYYDEQDDAENCLYKVVFKNQNFLDQQNNSAGQNQAVIRIDSAFNITLMQGFDFARIMDLIKFCDIVKFDTVAQFEITRSSAIRAFDCGMDSKKILSFIKENSGFAVPETLEFSIKEWEDSYRAVSIYKGFVLKLNEANSSLVMRNKIFKEHIFEQLAPNVVLLDCKNEEELRSLLARCGIENAGSIKSVEEEFETQIFLSLETTAPATSKGNTKPLGSEKQKGIFAAPEKTLQEIFEKIELLELDEEQKNTLRDIAASKIIVNSSQLCAPAIPLEKNSAQGMDYAGKVHVVEQAIRNKELILFRLKKGAALQTGIPLGLDRENFADGFYVNLFVGNSQKKYSIGKIEFIQRLHKLGILE